MAQRQITEKTYGVRDFVQHQSRQLGSSVQNGKSSIKSKLSKIDRDEEDDDLGRNLKKV